MSKIGCREVYFNDAIQLSRIDYLIDKVKEALKEMSLPSEYDVRVYRNVQTCCGVGGLGLVVEVVGPDEERIKAIDLRAMSRILEFCEEEGVDITHHSFGQHETL
jgi:hypothetical protein